MATKKQNTQTRTQRRLKIAMTNIKTFLFSDMWKARSIKAYLARFILYSIVVHSTWSLDFWLAIAVPIFLGATVDFYSTCIWETAESLINFYFPKYWLIVRTIGWSLIVTIVTSGLLWDGFFSKPFIASVAFSVFFIGMSISIIIAEKKHKVRIFTTAPIVC